VQFQQVGQKLQKLFYVFFIVSGSSGNLLCFRHHHILKINRKKWQNQYAQLSITQIWQNVDFIVRFVGVKTAENSPFSPFHPRTH
jgi:hypothetical protein